MSDFTREYDAKGRVQDLFNPPTPPIVSFADDDTAYIKSKLNMFDPTNPDTGLFNVIDGELIKISGSELLIFSYIADENYDQLYDENRAKTHYKPPKLAFGHYDPRPIEENLSEFGIELTNDQIFTFNKRAIELQIGRKLIAGDVIKPKFQNIFYEVYEVQEDSFEAYGVFHLVCSAKVMRDVSEVVATIEGHADSIDSTSVGGTIESALAGTGLSKGPGLPEGTSQCRSTITILTTEIRFEGPTPDSDEVYMYCYATFKVRCKNDKCETGICVPRKNLPDDAFIDSQDWVRGEWGWLDYDNGKGWLKGFDPNRCTVEEMQAYFDAMEWHHDLICECA